jgi:F-type H+-transporting ATPase subunit b
MLRSSWNERKMVADAKNEAQVQGFKMIEQAANWKRKMQHGRIETQFNFCHWALQKNIDELSNKEAQTKLVEKMLGDVKLN